MCGGLLVSRGIRAKLKGAPAQGGPLLCLNALTLSLLKELGFDCSRLCAHGHELCSHFVAWGSRRGMVHRHALAISLAELAGTVGGRISMHADADPDWTVLASGRNGALHHADRTVCCGRRVAVSFPVSLAAGAREDRTVMETVPGGWLFLMPTARGSGVIQAVMAANTDQDESLLRESISRSHYVNQCVEDITGKFTSYPAMPAFCLPAGSHAWLAVGDAAVAQDPLSGEGVGTAIRSAALAAAVLAAVAGGEDEQDCIEYYSRRLARAMRIHLEVLLEYYGELNDPAWNDEIAAMRAGLDLLRTVSPPGGFWLQAGPVLQDVSGRQSL